MIGTFGDLVFVASTQQLRTFRDFRRASSARWATSEVYRRHPKSQYIGPGQDEISFSMHFDARFGVHPRKEVARLTQMCRDGVVAPLIIGGLPFGTGKWYIESVNQTWDVFDNAGRLLAAGAEVQLKEYA
jgi:phage protein U